MLNNQSLLRALIICLSRCFHAFQRKATAGIVGAKPHSSCPIHHAGVDVALKGTSSWGDPKSSDFVEKELIAELDPRNAGLGCLLPG